MLPASLTVFGMVARWCCAMRPMMKRVQFRRPRSIDIAAFLRLRLADPRDHRIEFFRIGSTRILDDTRRWTRETTLWFRLPFRSSMVPCSGFIQCTPSFDGIVHSQMISRRRQFRGFVDTPHLTDLVVFVIKHRPKQLDVPPLPRLTTRNHTGFAGCFSPWCVVKPISHLCRTRI